MKTKTKVNDTDIINAKEEGGSLNKKVDNAVKNKTGKAVEKKTAKKSVEDKTAKKTVAKKSDKVAEKKVDTAAENKIDKAIEKIPAVVKFILVSKIKLCFRECAAIVKVAEDTGCLIEIAAGTKSGTSDSILSLVNLAINVDKSLVLTIHGENNHEAFERVSKILNGKSEETKS